MELSLTRNDSIHARLSMIEELLSCIFFSMPTLSFVGRLHSLGYVHVYVQLYSYISSVQCEINIFTV